MSDFSGARRVSEGRAKFKFVVFHVSEGIYVTLLLNEKN